MSETTLRLDRVGPVATVTLDRPDRGNAIGMTMVRELSSSAPARDEAAETVLVIRGAGGTLLRHRPARLPPEASRYPRLLALGEGLPDDRAPAHGHHRGHRWRVRRGGLQLALTCDARWRPSAPASSCTGARRLPAGMGTFRLAVHRPGARASWP
jgi:enoyl-CoA hydratase/carnithine racemase